MWLIHAALRRPITVIVAIVAIALCSILALTRMRIDIFPNLNLPVVYVAQPYGGMDPSQMEGYLVQYYEYHFLYINGIEHVESKSIQNVGLVKLVFHPGTDMSQALAQTVSYVDRARAFMPYGTVPPFVMRFDAGSVPVGYLVFSSATRSIGEIQDAALFRVRPLFSTLPGVSAPIPFGGNQRTIVIHVEPDRLRAYRMSAEEVVKAIGSGNAIVPAGIVNAGDLTRIAPVNSVVKDIHQLDQLPLRVGSGPAVFLRDVGWVEDSTDIPVGYALVNGARSVYLPVTKRWDASTLTVVNEVKEAMPRLRAAIPQDISIDFAFDQSGLVKSSLNGVVREGLLGALLTGLMVLLFLGDWRSSAIVVTTIPFALLTAVVALWGSNQTINIMTLGGLALAVGVLVDEATVSIENIHTHVTRGVSQARAALDASKEVVIPRLLAMLCVLGVFVPSFFMVGVARSLFVPLALAVGFSMMASYFLSSSLVPVMSAWLLRERRMETTEAGASRFEKFREKYAQALGGVLRWRWRVVGLYVLAALGIVLLLGPMLGREIFPQVHAGLFQLRFRAPAGTRIERTKEMTLKVLDTIKETAGSGNVAASLGYIGTQPTSYPVDTIYLWTSGPHEAVLLIALDPRARTRVDEIEGKLREKLPTLFPGSTFSFEAGDVVSQVMNFGAATPIEIQVNGPNLSDDRGYAGKLMAELKRIPALQDLQFSQALDYPSLDINVDRVRAGQMGVTVQDVGRSVAEATSSSRFIAPNYWADPRSGIAYQVQVEIPESKTTGIHELENTPVMVGPSTDGRPLLGDVAQLSYGTVVGEYDRYNMQRMVTITGNVAGEDLGRAAAQVDDARRRAGAPPRGVTPNVRGQIAPMREALANLELGLALAVLVIFLLLAANFQSLRLAFVVIATVPAVIAGIVLALLLTGTTLNVQSFMGSIMAIGVALANAILLVTFAEQYRREGLTSVEAAARGAVTRMRPVLMTSLAMVAGMVPMAFAFGEGGEQTAPLGRAVIGGLVAATVATLLILPSVFAIVQGRASARSASLDPDDPASAFHAE